MSLLKKMKNKKLNAVVYASIMAFGISGNVEATSYPPLFSGPVYNEGFALPSGGDFSGYYDWPSLVENLDFSQQFTIGLRSEIRDGIVENRYLYYSPTDTQFWGYTLEGGQVYLIERETESGHQPDNAVIKLGDAETVLSTTGGITEDEIKDLISNVQGDQTVNGSQDITGDQTVEGEQTVNGGQTVTGGQTVNGDSTTTGDSTTKGDGNIEGDLNVGGDGNVDGDMNVGFDGADDNGDGTPDRPGDLNVAGDSNINGNETVDGNETVKGDSFVEGNQDVTGDSHIGGNETVDGNETVKGDSFVEGNQDVTGDSHIGGNETVDGNETVKGDSFVEGNGHFDGNVSIGNRDENGNATDSSDLDVTGNGNFGGDVNIGHDGVDEDGDGTPDRPGNLDVAGDSHLTGDTQVGSRDDNGAVVDRSDLDVTGNANLGGDTFVGFDGADSNGDGVVDRPGNMYIAGDTVIGVPGVPGAESNLHVTGNTTIDHDLYVGGEGHFDGNLYAPDLIFNGGKSLTGEISRLDGRIDTAGANAAALAGLHPLDFDEDQKLNFAAAVGSYQGASAMALGMFYRPDDRTMFNLGGTFGNRENMATLGVSFALDGPNAVSRSSKKKMQEQIVQLTAANAVMAENNAKMQTELEELKAMVMELKAEKAA